VVRFGIKTPSDPGNEHIVTKSMICGVKSSGRTRHTRGCSAKNEEYQHSQGLNPLSPTFKMSMFWKLPASVL